MQICDIHRRDGETVDGPYEIVVGVEHWHFCQRHLDALRDWITIPVATKPKRGRPRKADQSDNASAPN